MLRVLFSRCTPQLCISSIKHRFSATSPINNSTRENFKHHSSPIPSRPQGSRSARKIPRTIGYSSYPRSFSPTGDLGSESCRRSTTLCQSLGLKSGSAVIAPHNRAARIKARLFRRRVAHQDLCISRTDGRGRVQRYAAVFPSFMRVRACGCMADARVGGVCLWKARAVKRRRERYFISGWGKVRESAWILEVWGFGRWVSWKWKCLFVRSSGVGVGLLWAQCLEGAVFGMSM